MILFTNGIIHSVTDEHETYGAMLVDNGIIKKLYEECNPIIPELSGEYNRRSKHSKNKCRIVDLGGKHVYPCLIDGHVHMLLTIAVLAMGFNICEIGKNGVTPNTIEGIKERLTEYASHQKKNAIIACNNYILTAIDEQRMPSREELDEWCGGRPAVIYNIDGHSTALSSKMLELVGIDPNGHSGILQGEENERTQGRIIDKLGSMITLPMLAAGIARFQNTCASYGISVVGALEGNGDSPKDITTKLIAHLARHFDVGVRLYLQYTDISRVEPFRKFMRHPRIGGCGDWEMDGAVGAHSAAMHTPYKDTKAIADCYYTQEQADRLVANATSAGYQVASHAIGEAAIERLVAALDRIETKVLHRVEHCEFMSDAAFAKICEGRYAVMIQPGYAWIDKRFLHTYEKFLSEEVISRMKLKGMFDAGVCVCGSSDAPVQDIDPYLQMLGMVQYYNESESVSPFEAFRSYTINAARAILEEDERGSLEVGKAADFFTADENFYELSPEELVAFRPDETWYGGRKYREKNGSVLELISMLFRKARRI